METEPQSESSVQSIAVKKGFSGLQAFGLIILTFIVTALIGWWVVRTYIFPTQLAPVELSQQEQVELDRKLMQLGFESQGITIDEQGRETAVPTPYSEDPAGRNVTLTERELNSLLAGDADLANNVDLAQRFGGADGFWGSFSRGVGEIQILEGKLQISVKE
jgi:hypothetical protein